MTRVLIVSHEQVGQRMAGPAIRYRELARVLARQVEVTLAVPGEPGGHAGSFEVWPYRRGSWDSLGRAARRADVIVACGDTLADFPPLAELDTPLIIDGYDPHTLETLALWGGEPVPVQTARHRQRLDVLSRQCQAGDFFICASERQRDWWLGVLEHEGRVNPYTYGLDPSLRRLIDVVPYGLPAEPPQATRPVLRGVWPGIEPGDRILLWGGGLWEWLDPLSALRAVRRLVDGGLEHIRLVFPGTRHPNPDMPDMPMRARALALADALGLTSRYAFFGDWVPHKDWPSVLLEADVGLSLHPDTAEARQAFRSRVLDYIWAGLPMVVTRGDVISEVVEDRELGIVVGFGDDAAVAGAIRALVEQPQAAWQDRFARVRTEMTWEQAARPLVAFCQNPCRAADRRSTASLSYARPGPGTTQVMARQEQEIARLEDQLAGLERDSLIRLARWLGSGWHRVRNTWLVEPWADAVLTALMYRHLTREVGRCDGDTFVDRAYRHILGRAPDPEGFKHFVDMLAEGRCSRRGVVSSLVRSTEFRTQARPKAGLVGRVYEGRQR